MGIRNDVRNDDLLDESDDNEDYKLDFGDNTFEPFVNKKQEQKKSAKRRYMIRQKIELYKEQLQLRKDMDLLSYDLD